MPVSILNSTEPPGSAPRAASRAIIRRATLWEGWPFTSRPRPIQNRDREASLSVPDPVSEDPLIYLNSLCRRRRIVKDPVGRRNRGVTESPPRPSPATHRSPSLTDMSTMRDPGLAAIVDLLERRHLLYCAAEFLGSNIDMTRHCPSIKRRRRDPWSLQEHHPLKTCERRLTGA